MVSILFIVRNLQFYYTNIVLVPRFLSEYGSSYDISYLFYTCADSPPKYVFQSHRTSHQRKQLKYFQND